MLGVLVVVLDQKTLGRGGNLVPPQLASLLESNIRADEDKTLLPNYQKYTEPRLKSLVPLMLASVALRCQIDRPS